MSGLRAPVAPDCRVDPPAAPGRPPSAGDRGGEAAAGLGIEQRRRLDLRPEDAAALDRLIASRPEAGLFVSEAWLSGYFAEPPAGFEPSVLLFRDGCDLRGAVPLAVRSGLTHTCVRLLGGGAGSDRVDLLADRGCEAGCADAFLSWLATTFGERAFVLELRDVPAESPLWGALHRANAEGRLSLTLQPREIHALPYLDLREAPRPAWTSGSLDRHRRWLERRGDLRVDVIEDPSEALRALDALAGLLHVRWRGRRRPSVLDSPHTFRFHQRVIPRLLRGEQLRMIRLAVERRPVAVFYGVANADWRGYYLAGYDREWAGRIHLGQIVLAIAMEHAAREGAGQFDFLKGAERVKYLWPVRERATLDADVYPAHAAAQLSRAVRATRDAAAAAGKAARLVFSQ